MIKTENFEQVEVSSAAALRSWLEARAARVREIATLSAQGKKLKGS